MKDMIFRRPAGWFLVAGLAGLFAVGCGGDDRPIRSDDEQAYVDLMIRLSLIDARPPDTGSAEERERAADSLRAEVLAAHGMEPDDLLALSERLGDDPARMERLWDQIVWHADSAIALHDLEAIARRDSLAERTRFQAEAEGEPAVSETDFETLLDTVSDPKRRRLLEQAQREQEGGS